MFTRQLPQKKKSCGGCVKSKRKCDLILPRCGRCTKQGLSCEYPFAEAVVQEQQVADLSFTPSAMIAEPKLGFDFSAPPQLDLFSADTNFFAFDDSIASMPSFDPPDVVPSEAHVMSQPSYEVALLNGPHVGFSAASLNQWSASRLLFAMDIFRNAPATMVGENQTPWSHPRLYDDVMPRCLSGAGPWSGFMTTLLTLLQRHMPLVLYLCPSHRPMRTTYPAMSKAASMNSWLRLCRVP